MKCGIERGEFGAFLRGYRMRISRNREGGKVRPLGSDPNLDIAETLFLSSNSYLLGLLAMIKCSICSYQCEN